MHTKFRNGVNCINNLFDFVYDPVYTERLTIGQPKATQDT